jgi:hypothetical protein
MGFVLWSSHGSRARICGTWTDKLADRALAYIRTATTYTAVCSGHQSLPHDCRLENTQEIGLRKHIHSSVSCLLDLFEYYCPFATDEGV